MKKFLIVLISMVLAGCASHNLPEPKGKVFPINNVTEVYKNATTTQ